jgi:hypothetical protein
MRLPRCAEAAILRLPSRWLQSGLVLRVRIIAPTRNRDCFPDRPPPRRCHVVANHRYQRARVGQLMRDAIAVVAIASALRLDDTQLEARRVQLVRTALDRGHETTELMQAWVHQLRSEYRGSHTAWDLGSTSAQLRLALDRFDTTIAEVATHLRDLAPDAIEQAMRAREGRS